MGPISVLSKTETEISLAWSALKGVLTGDSAITEYILYWDNGTGVVDILLTNQNILNYRVKGTTGGVTYRFAVAASNVYGQGLTSDVLVSLASDVPDIIPIVATSIVGTDVLVTWSMPDPNFEPLLEYDIVFLSSTGAFVREATNCGGEDPAIL
jgi:hypothetical protein